MRDDLDQPRESDRDVDGRTLLLLILEAEPRREAERDAGARRADGRGEVVPPGEERRERVKRGVVVLFFI